MISPVNCPRGDRWSRFPGATSQSVPNSGVPASAATAFVAVTMVPSHFFLRHSFLPAEVADGALEVIRGCPDDVWESANADADAKQAVRQLLSYTVCSSLADPAAALIPPQAKWQCCARSICNLCPVLN